MKGLKWRAIFVALVLGASIVYLLPSLPVSLPQWWHGTLPDDKIHLGLDLQGGMHLVLEVQAQEAVKTTLDRLSDELKELLRKEKIGFRAIERTQDGQLALQLSDASRRDRLRELMDKEFPILEWVQASETSEGFRVICRVKDKEAEHIRQLAVSQALETIRNRIDQFGVSEPDIRPQGENRILVQLPGIKDPKRALELIGKTAMLEFKLVAEGVDPHADPMTLPAGVRVYPMRRVDANAGRTVEGKVALKDRTLLTGEYITNANVRIDTQYNTPYVALEFDPQGARIFERITGENVKKQLAIVLDGMVYSAPVIQEKISGGRASITGSFTMEEARDLAIVLRAGALPAPVVILEERTVGPSLGADSIRKGFLSMVIGTVAIVLFMILYYRVSGLVADLALLLNVVLIMAGLAAFQATLTLPGIAGIILTIGMAVDANVLIFERIREEMRLGKTPKAAFDAGYARATLTILDANITTLIASLVMFQFGTGPVKGFAVTLSIGIVASLFTGLVVTRLVFDYLFIERRIRALSI